MFTRPANWKQLSREEKRKLRLDPWQNSPGLPFVSPRAEALYGTHRPPAQMAYDLEPPDRIIADMSMGAGEYALRRKGFIGKDMVYNHEKLREPLLEFHNEFQPDVAVWALSIPAKRWISLGFKTYIWGGQKLPDKLVIQAVEGEYMTGDEYDDFTADPTAFWMNKYLPRAFGELAPLAMLPDFPRVSESVDMIGAFLPFGLPPFQEMLKKMMEAGNESLKWAGLRPDRRAGRRRTVSPAWAIFSRPRSTIWATPCAAPRAS